MSDARPRGSGSPEAPAFERRAADWLSPEEALARVLARAAPLESEEVALEEAVGRVLREDVAAEALLPPWDNSAMDGYAVRAADTAGASAEAPARLRVAGHTHAGDPVAGPVGTGEAVRIMTGAPLPPGADAVVRVEDTDREAERAGEVAIRVPIEEGRHVRPAGEDVRPGQVPLEAGRTVTPGVVGLAAALGRARLTVHRRPTVAILATGSELRGPERYDDVRAGRGVPESNGPMLAAMAREAGALPRLLAVAVDTPDALRARLEEASGADALVTIGGASMGEADLVKRVLDELGYRPDFWRVRMRPGSPVGFGTLPRPAGAQPVFTLPGNPSSAFVTFEVFVRPWLRRVAGHRRPLAVPLRGVAAEELRGPDGLTTYLRVRMEASGDPADPPRVRLTGPQSSGLVRGLADADALAVLPEGVGRIAAGEAVTVLPLRTDAGPCGGAPAGGDAP